MKKINFILIILTVILLNGCFIKSIHPFYKEKNVIFKPELVGTWMDQDSAVWKIEQYKRSLGFMKGDTVENSYLMVFTDIKGNKTVYNTHLFELDGEYYLDFFPILEELLEDNLAYYSIIPSHSLAKIFIRDQNQVQVSFFNEEWLGNLFKENRIIISHEKMIINQDYDTRDTYVLTASTNELQKFILKYGNDPKVFKAIWEAHEEDQDNYDFTFLLKRIDD